MHISVNECCELLKKEDNIVILSHRNPDGDTFGCAFALYNILKFLGKKSRVECSDGFSDRYSFLYEGYEKEDFIPQYIVAVDIADEKLLGDPLESKYSGKIDLCIDHHPTNKEYATHLLLDASAAAACEIMEKVCIGLNVPISRQIANCIYTGVSTDTGCFCYSNTSKNTHECAGRMIEAGCDLILINRLMFEVKSQARISLEKEILETVEYPFEECALICITNEMLERTGASENELDSIASMPRQIEGIEIGITMRERQGEFKVSVRTGEKYDACEICSNLGGGGHKRASGCTVQGDFQTAKSKILDVIRTYMQSLEEK